MEIEILFFARLRELAGTDAMKLELPVQATVADALEELARACPAVGSHLRGCRTALNEEFTTSDALIPPHGVLAIIPPVSGG